MELSERKRSTFCNQRGSRAQIKWGLLGRDRDFVFCSKCDEQPLEHFECRETKSDLCFHRSVWLL